MKSVVGFVRGIAFVALVAVVAGCASGAKPVAILPTDAPAVAADNKYREQAKITQFTGGEETSPLLTSEISSADFKTALETAMSLAKFKNPAGSFSLQVQLIEIDQPLIGLSMTVGSKVKYTLTDASDMVVFSEIFQATHTAQFSESFLAVERLRLANEGSARANIREFLSPLEIHGQASSNDAATS